MSNAIRILIACCLVTTATAEQCGTSGNPMLGVQMSPTPLRVATQQNLTVGQGVLIRRVFPGTAASTMGVQTGDVIVAINNNPIHSMTSLRNVIEGTGVGQNVQVTVRRNGQDLAFQPTALQQWPTEIPHQPIDHAAEDRYIDMQRRMANNREDQARQNTQTLDGLRSRNNDLDKELDQARKGNETRAPSAPQSPVRDPVWSRGCNEMKQAKALGINWRFAYDMAVADPAPIATTVVEPAPLALPTLPLQLVYAFTVNSERL